MSQLFAFVERGSDRTIYSFGERIRPQNGIKILVLHPIVDDRGNHVDPRLGKWLDLTWCLMEGSESICAKAQFFEHEGSLVVAFESIVGWTNTSAIYQNINANKKRSGIQTCDPASCKHDFRNPELVCGMCGFHISVVDMAWPKDTVIDRLLEKQWKQS